MEDSEPLNSRELVSKLIKDTLSEELLKTTNKIKEIERIKSMNPYEVIQNARIEAGKIQKRHPNNYKLVAALIKPHAQKEKEALKIMKKQASSELIGKEISLRLYKRELESRLYFEERR